MKPMPATLRLAAACGLLLAAAATGAAPATLLATGAKITAPGRYEIRLREGGRERMALVHVPRDWRAGTPAPLVMALHGGGGSAAYQARDARYGLISKSEEAGFIAVFPNGISPARSGLLASTPGACTPSACPMAQ